MSAVGERNDYGLTAWDRYRILTECRTIAMVGLSSNYYNASSFAAIYLDANGYDIVPVNPAQAGKREILGRRVYASLREAAADLARAAGLQVVMDRCCKIEHARFFGGLRTIGLNTGVVTSRLAMRLPEGD